MKFVWFALFTLPTLGQSFSFEKLNSNVEASFRGLDVISTKTAWVSGTGGTVLKTNDGGDTWENISVPNSSTVDFRDIEVFDKNTAIVMGISSPARFYKTKNGGKNWDLVYFNDHKDIFFDGMSFWSKKMQFDKNCVFEQKVLFGTLTKYYTPYTKSLPDALGRKKVENSLKSSFGA